MKPPSLQVRFFQYIKEHLSPGLVLVDEVADLLSVSTDSAYRRLRGETSMTMDELGKLARHFNVSVDQLIETSSSEVVFQFKPLSETEFNFMDYLASINAQMEIIASADEKEVVYMANEIPLFHLMHSPELASFKLFFWQKTILDFSTFRNLKFAMNERDESVNEISRHIRDLYCRIPSTEIYHSETIDTTLKQIQYYYESGYFEDKADALKLLDALTGLVNHIKMQCEAGFKFKRTDSGQIPERVPYRTENNYQVFYNEVLHTDNNILVRMGDSYLSFLTSNGISSLATTNEAFYKSAYDALQILKRRSTLISGTSEKARNKVFLGYHQKIDRLRQKFSG